MSIALRPPTRRRARRALVYAVKAVAVGIALTYTIALTGTILGTAVGILINEWSRR